MAACLKNLYGALSRVRLWLGVRLANPCVGGSGPFSDTLPRTVFVVPVPTLSLAYGCLITSARADRFHERLTERNDFVIYDPTCLWSVSGYEIDDVQTRCDLVISPLAGLPTGKNPICQFRRYFPAQFPALGWARKTPDAKPREKGGCGSASF